MPTFDTPGEVLVRVANEAGEVRIETTDGPTTDVELEALRDDDATHSAIADARVETRERRGRTEVIVEIPRRGGGRLLSRGPEVGVRVHCPHGADLEVSTASADVIARGRLGAVTAQTASGQLELGVANGEVKVSTASGDVTVAEVGGAATIKTASGDVAVRVAGAALSANTASGDVAVTEARGPLVISTVSGDQAIRSIGTGEVKLQAVSGDVEVGIPPGLRLWIDASSVSGSMSSDLDLEDEQPAGEGEVVELRVRTVSGDVRIQRVGAPARA
jgi:DUF4097 and DUF4098 domain-containing protein YvlB